MKRQIDINRLLEMDKDLPPSPHDPRITIMGITSLLIYLLAGFCAWKFGGWWGVGFIVCLYVISTLDEFVHEEHRQELVEGYGRLVRMIAENSDILDNIIPKKEKNNDYNEHSP